MDDRLFHPLQLFAQGEAGVTVAADAGQQEMAGENRAETGPDAAAQPPSQQHRMTWEEVKQDPEFNREIQAIIQNRLRREQRRDVRQDPRETEQEMPPAMEEAHFHRHIQGLQQQAQAMREVFPGFDLHRELRNPAFARMTAPDVGISVEDAYYALHRQQIQAAAMEVTAQRTAQMLSDTIQAGAARPREQGGGGQGATVAVFDYRSASPEQRTALKKKIREANARGEKLFPDGSVRR